MSIKRCAFIPVGLKNKIDEAGFTKTQKSHATRFVTKLLYLQKTKDVNIYDFYPLPANYIVKAFNSRYNEFLSILKSAGIVEVQGNEYNNVLESYQVDKFCKAYRINPSLLITKFTKTSWEEKGNAFNDKFIYINNKRCEKLIVENDIASLIIDSKKLLNATDMHIAAITPGSFKINGEVTEQSFWVKSEGYEGYTSLSKCLQGAKRNGLTLIQDGRDYYVDNLDDYIFKKKGNIRFNYESTIANLENGEYYVNRNSTNQRLDNVLTCTSKILLEVIKADNNLGEIDLANSQFAFLSNKMQQDPSFKPTDDFNTFKQQTAVNTLYTYVQKEFGLSQRDEGKKMMLQLAFCSHAYRSKDKKLLRKLFPSVVNYIDSYKKKDVKDSGDKDAYKEFSVMLQKAESKMFIDNLYYNLKIKQGLWVLTKHDSLLVKAEDEKYVRDFMERYFKSINFDCTLK